MTTHVEAEKLRRLFENEFSASVLNIVHPSMNLLNVTVTNCMELYNFKNSGLEDTN